MVILATYGYKQSQVFNINCKVAPLLDIIRRSSHSDIIKLLQTRHEQVLKEVAEITAKLEAKEKKLHFLENPPPQEEVKETPIELLKKKSSKDLKKFPKSSHALAEAKRLEEEKKKAEEEAKKIEEAKKLEEAKKIEEDKKKKKEEPKKAKKDETKELSPEEIKQQQIEAQKADLRKFIEENSRRVAKLQEKVEMIQGSLEKFAEMPREIDLVDQSGIRKFLLGRDEEIASRILNTRSVYGVVVIEGEGFNAYEVNGFCIRTIEEDANYVEEVDPKSKNKPKTGTKKK